MLLLAADEKLGLLPPAGLTVEYAASGLQGLHQRRLFLGQAVFI
jgi:hypothetical protein